MSTNKDPAVVSAGRKLAFAALRIILAGVLLFLVLVSCSARRMVFQPFRTLQGSAADLNRPYEDIFLTTSDRVKINAWFFPAPTNALDANRVFLICHGNAGNLSHRLELIEMLLECGVSVFAFDYRGYGRSTGRPTERGTYEDALTAYGWLREKGFAASNIVALGESLGGGVACELAVRQPLGGLVLQSTFTSVPDLGAEMMPWLPVRWVLTTRYHTRRKLPQLRLPVLILHSRADRSIPFHHAERNFAAANEPKFLFELAGDHNDALTAGGQLYAEAIRHFLKRL